MHALHGNPFLTALSHRRLYCTWRHSLNEPGDAPTMDSLALLLGWLAGLAVVALVVGQPRRQTRFIHSPPLSFATP